MCESQLAAPMLVAPPKTANRGFVRARRAAPADRRAQAQESLNLRFSGLKPSDFHADGILIYASTTLDPPDGFEDAWHVLHADLMMDEDEVKHVSSSAAVLIVADPEVTEEVRNVMAIAKVLRNINAMCPLIWLPHSSKLKAYVYDGFDPTIHKQVLQSGVAEVIAGRPEGVELAIAVRSRISRQATLASKVNRTLDMQREKNARAENLLGSINHIVWNQCRVRLGFNAEIPNMDASFGIPGVVSGLEKAQLVGSGSFGKVYSLNTPGKSSSGEVLKCVKKAPFSDIRLLKSTRHQIRIMRMLSNEYAHPNIAKLYEVYHNQTHISFRMEDAGSINLFKRLHMREETNQDNGDISSTKVVMLIMQSIRAVEHLHSMCHIAHLDIKPENICIKETPEKIMCKLIDFDAAVIVKPLERCRNLCGTFPFTAPEVYVPPYRPLPADMWSLGLVLCEILCGPYVFDRSLHLAEHLRRYDENRSDNDEPTSSVQVARARHVMPMIAQHFANEGAAGVLVQNYAFSELTPLAVALASMFDRMIIQSVQNRISAAGVLQMAESALHAQCCKGSADAVLVAKN